MKRLTYAEHYVKCKKDSGYEPPQVNLYDFEFAVIDPTSHDKNNLVVPPKNYLEIVNNAKNKYNKLFESESNLQISPYPDKDFGIRLQEIYESAEFEALAQAIIPQLEKNLFGCPAILECVFAYKNIYRNAPERSSWMWHWDNHPKEIIKVMVYLSDVDEHSGAFEVLCNDKGEAIKKETLRVDYNTWDKAPFHGRLRPYHVARFRDKGYQPQKILGQKGTISIFDNNIVHKASIPAPGNDRDVIVFQIRPWPVEQKIYINKNHTRSWSNAGRPTKNPEQI